MLSELGVIKPTELVDLDDDDVSKLMTLIPKIKITKFKSQLAILRPVTFLIIS